MTATARCRPGTTNLHTPIEHDQCVRDWYAQMGMSRMNTRTCQNHPGTDHSRCGPHCRTAEGRQT